MQKGEKYEKLFRIFATEFIQNQEKEIERKQEI